MTTQSIVQFGFGAVFILGLVIALYVAYRRGWLSSPVSRTELLRRSAIRLGCCALPYLVLAEMWRALNDNDVLFHGFWFWFAVVLIPGLGLVLDLSRHSAGSIPPDRYG